MFFTPRYIGYIDKSKIALEHEYVIGNVLRHRGYLALLIQPSLPRRSFTV